LLFRSDLAPTHTALLEGDYTRTILMREWPAAIEQGNTLATFSLRDRPMTLAEITPIARFKLRRRLGHPVLLNPR
jgi:hypothetical protein